MALKLGLVGPAQSNDLYHFTGRQGERPVWVPQEIRDGMGPQQRLEAILREERLRAFAPFGAAASGLGASGVPCLCFSESPPDHLDHLIQLGRFDPWGVVLTRETVHTLGGGAVAYVPPKVHKAFVKANLGHWAVRTDEHSAWHHEREWRIPVPDGAIALPSLRAILVEDAKWRPAKVPSGAWLDSSTGEHLPGPDPSPFATELEDYPRLWRESPVWVWDRDKRVVVKYSPGELC